VSKASTSTWPTTPPTASQRAAYALIGTADADLGIVGGGFTGLCAALHAKADEPGRDVVVLEAETCGFGASGRNGGFAVSSLTHGLENGIARFPEEARELERLGLESFEGLVADIERLGIDCDLERTGDISALLDPAQALELEEAAALRREHGHEVELLDAAAMRAEIHSPAYHGGLWDRTGSALVHPGKLALGLRRGALEAGVRLHEHSAASELRERGAGIEVVTAQGRVRARRVLLATSAFPPLLRSIGRYVAPVYDYALVSEPLDAAQRASIGWSGRQGVGDSANQFHYARLTPDDRILFGGFDAIYRFGGPVSSRLDDHEPTFARLSQHLFTTFPQLDGLRFSHRWGGAIDTCSRFCVFFGTSHGGRVSYATGYTGLGVAEAAALSARAAALRRHPADGQPARCGRPQRRPARALAEDARPARARLRQLTQRGAMPAGTSVAGAGLPM
jgi:glycine/D-amino acid oxidase-like deaminating enzyme